MAAAELHHLSFSRGPDNLTEVSWLLPASKADTAAVGVSRSHGSGCGECTWGRTPADLDSHPGESASRALCPVRTAARHVLHTLDLAQRLGRDPSHFPLLPNIRGNVPTKEAVSATIEEAALGVGIPTHHPDGHKKFGGHALRVAGAQSLSWAGFDAWTIGLLASWGRRRFWGTFEMPLWAP